MAQRRFGPTLGAGVVIIEEQADNTKAIVKKQVNFIIFITFPYRSF